MSTYDSVVVIGSSGNGKTTLVNELRKHSDIFLFPKRYITRPRRKGDDLTENKHVLPEQFDELQAKGKLEIVWSRPLGSTRIERYSFENLPKQTGQLVVYSGNNALLRDNDAVLPDDLFDRCLIILVKTSKDIRKKRIFDRSPDITREELEIRIADDGLDLVEKADLVIDTNILNPDQVREVVLSFIKNAQK